MFPEFDEMSGTMEKEGVAVRVRDLTARWVSPSTHDKEKATDKLLDPVSCSKELKIACMVLTA